MVRTCYANIKALEIIGRTAQPLSSNQNEFATLEKKKKKSRPADKNRITISPHSNSRLSSAGRTEFNIISENEGTKSKVATDKSTKNEKWEMLEITDVENERISNWEKSVHSNSDRTMTMMTMEK